MLETRYASIRALLAIHPNVHVPFLQPKTWDEKVELSKWLDELRSSVGSRWQFVDEHKGEVRIFQTRQGFMDEWQRSDSRFNGEANG